MIRDLVLPALAMALGSHKPEGNLLTVASSGDYSQLLDSFEITCSISRKGNCWDNALCQ